MHQVTPAREDDSTVIPLRGRVVHEVPVDDVDPDDLNSPHTLAVLSGQVTGGLVGGNNNTTTFHRYYGDVTGDATVNGLDFGPFRTAFGTIAGNPLYLDYLDFNGDGVINGIDFGEFRPRFGIPLP